MRTRILIVTIVCCLYGSWIAGPQTGDAYGIGRFGISGIIPDTSAFDDLLVDCATSGFWIGASAGFFGGSKEELHTRQFRGFAERGIANIGTFYLGNVSEDTAAHAADIVSYYTTGQGAIDVGAPVLYWEVGDEENGSWGTGCAPEEYARRVAVLAEGIRQGCPSCQIVMGGLLDGAEMGDWALEPYLNAFLAAGGGEWVDVYAFHYFGLARPREQWPGAQLYSDAEALVASMRRLLQSYGEGDSPIWVTETSTFSGQVGETVQTEAEQAADLVKRYVFLWSLGVDVVQWCYLTEPQYEGTGEGFFDQSGLIYDGEGPFDRGAGIRKKSFYAYQQLIEELSGATLLGRETSNGLTWVQFEQDGQPLSVLWQDPWICQAPVWIEPDGDVRVVDLYGDLMMEAASSCRLDLDLAPVYIHGRLGSVSTAAPALQGTGN